jgi:lipid A 3-O-deacylase
MKRIVILLLFFAPVAFGQSIDYYEHLFYQKKKRFVFSFDNDFFVATDRYYSQGLSLAYKTPVLDPDHWTNGLFLYKGGTKMAGFSIEQMGFTPTSIAYDTILSDDRPFAGTIRANFNFESIDSARNFALNWQLSAGIIGPEAFVGETQEAVHRWTDNPHPQGWENQIQTGLLLDANIYSHQQIAKAGTWLVLVSEEGANVGTSRIDLTLGPRIQVQWLTPGRDLHLALFANPAVRFVGYDGTLQGSLIGEKSPYVIRNADVSRVILEREFGAMARYKRFQMNGYVNINTRVYRTALPERWGGIRIIVFFK